MTAGLITAITPAPRNPGRFTLSVDSHICAVLSLQAIEGLGLAVGGSIAGKEHQIQCEAAAVRIFDRALNMLALRARSSRELSRSLIQKGEPADLVARVIDRLTEQGLLDDAAFAESFTRSKVLGARQSKRRVQQGLAKKGVSRAVGDAAIASVFEAENVDQRALVLQAARKKLRALAREEPEVRRRRLYGFLARRGYEVDDINAVMAELREELR